MQQNFFGGFEVQQNQHKEQQNGVLIQHTLTLLIRHAYMAPPWKPGEKLVNPDRVLQHMR